MFLSRYSILTKTSPIKLVKTAITQNSSRTLIISTNLKHQNQNQEEKQETASFGFEQVNKKEKQGKVNEVFDNVAKNYDIMNDAMSLGAHRAWKNFFVNRIAPNKQMRLIDVAGGTGDIAFRFLNQVNNNSSQPRTILDNQEQDKEEESQRPVTVCDINANMLEVGQRRAQNFNFDKLCSFKVGNAEELVNEPDNAYDVYTIAFGIRNCTNLEAVICEAYRVLKPGGRFMCLEFSHTTNEEFTAIYDYYSFNVIPVLGHLIAGDMKSYEYLVESIRMFPKQAEFKRLIEDCGFKHVSYENLTNGIVAIHTGFKLS